MFVHLCVEESSSDELCHNISLRALLWAPVTPVRPALVTPPWQRWGWMASGGPSSPSRAVVLCGVIHLIATAVPAQLKTLVVLTGADVRRNPSLGAVPPCPSAKWDATALRSARVTALISSLLLSVANLQLPSSFSHSFASWPKGKTKSRQTAAWDYEAKYSESVRYLWF